MITVTQAILIGLCCAIGKVIIGYTFGGFMFNTVIFNAVLVGAVMGDMKTAMIVGAALQLVYLGVISSGGNLPTDPCLSAFVAIPIAVASGLDTNAAIAIAVPIGLLGAQLTNIDYLLNGFFAQKADTYAEKGDSKGIVRWAVVYAGIVRALIFSVPVMLTVYFGSTALQGVLDNIPAFVTNGLSAMGSCLPAVGFAIIANLISKPRFIPFFFAGFFLIQYSHIGTIPLLLLGLFLMFLYVTFTKDEYMGHSDADDDDEEDEEEDEDEEAEVAAVRMLNKKDIFKTWSVWWLICEIGHSFERMQGPMFCTSVMPALKKIYKGEDKKEQYIEALKRHMTFFNSEAHWGGGTILGITLAMEEKKSQNYDQIPGEVILDLKTGLMGPMAGIGDTITWSTLMYLFIGLFLPLAQQGSALGGIGPVVCLTAVCFTIGYFLTYQCYIHGYSFAEKMLKSGLVNMVIAGASILGLFMMGGLASSYVTVSTPISFAVGTYSSTLQEILDAILPGILPLAVVLGVWGYLAKVKRNYFGVTVALTIIAFVLGALGIIA